MLKLSLLWTLCLLLFPLLLLQAFWVKRTALRLPDALGEKSTWSSGSAKHILGIGDSVIAGVGIDQLDQAMTAQFAEKIGQAFETQIAWTALGNNGDRIADLNKRLPLIDANAVDLIVVSIGVNDVTSLTSVTRWHFDVVTLVSELKKQFRVPIILLGIPPMGLFPALPQPLRFALGIRARMLDMALRQAGQVIDQVYWVESSARLEQGLMATDGYHPSATGCESWCQEISQQLKKQGLTF